MKIGNTKASFVDFSINQDRQLIFNIAFEDTKKWWQFWKKPTIWQNSFYVKKNIWVYSNTCFPVESKELINYLDNLAITTIKKIEEFEIESKFEIDLK